MQLEKGKIGLPKFQTSFKAGLQGAFNPKGRTEFLAQYMNRLVSDRERLRQLLQIQRFQDFIALTSKCHYPTHLFRQARCESVFLVHFQSIE